jgi:hypothetical protein
MLTPNPKQHPERRCKWIETIYNAYEPDNSIVFEGHPVRDGEIITCIADIMEFHGRFNDGTMYASITPRNDGTYLWIVDNKKGLVNSWQEAWFHMPAFLTNPDEFVEHSEWGLELD